MTKTMRLAAYMCASVGLVFACAEGRAEAYTWTEYCTASPCGSDGQPSVVTGTRGLGSATAPTVVPLAVSYGPEHLGYIWVLGSTTNSAGDYQLYEYKESTGTWSTVSDVYLRGVVSDGYTNAGTAFGWTKAGEEWDNTSGTWTNNFSGFTSVAPFDYASSPLYATNNSSTACANSDVPAGQCTESLSSWPSGTWGSWPSSGAQWGGEMITQDQIGGTFQLVVDSSGNAWGSNVAGASDESPTVGLLPMWNCLSETDISLAQVAGKYNGTGNSATQIYGLGHGGTVWAYNTYGGACPGDGWGWESVGSKQSWANSITVDNSTKRQVWATDSSGELWIAD
jgi:hypothetical protein